MIKVEGLTLSIPEIGLSISHDGEGHNYFFTIVNSWGSHQVELTDVTLFHIRQFIEDLRLMEKGLTTKCSLHGTYDFILCIERKTGDEILISCTTIDKECLDPSFCKLHRETALSSSITDLMVAFQDLFCIELNSPPPTEFRKLPSRIKALLSNRSKYAWVKSVHPQDLLWEINVGTTAWYTLFGFLSINPGADKAIMLKNEIIENILLAPGSLFIQHSQDPGDYDMPGTWVKVTTEQDRAPAWRCPDGWTLNLDNLWFRYGGWVLLKSDSWVTPPQFHWKKKVELFDLWMRTNNVQVIIESLYDDIEWTVGIASC